MTPVNGWKAYYAATRAIVNINAGFFNIIRDRSLPAMGHLWLNADYVKCVHASGEFFTGYDSFYLSISIKFLAFSFPAGLCCGWRSHTILRLYFFIFGSLPVHFCFDWA